VAGLAGRPSFYGWRSCRNEQLPSTVPSTKHAGLDRTLVGRTGGVGRTTCSVNCFVGWCWLSLVLVGLGWFWYWFSLVCTGKRVLAGTWCQRGCWNARGWENGASHSLSAQESTGMLMIGYRSLGEHARVFEAAQLILVERLIVGFGARRWVDAETTSTSWSRPCRMLAQLTISATHSHGMV